MSTVREFFTEHDSDVFPTENGPWIGEDHFDPAFNRSDLRSMEARGYIEIDCANAVWRYRFTGKGTNKRVSLCGPLDERMPS